MVKHVKVGAAGLALILAVCSAFTNAPNVQRAETTYGVTAETPDSFMVEDLTGQTQGEDYTCINSENICTVQADPSDVSDGAVAKSDATEPQEGTFQQ